MNLSELIEALVQNEKKSPTRSVITFSGSGFRLSGTIMPDLCGRWTLALTPQDSKAGIVLLDVSSIKSIEMSDKSLVLKIAGIHGDQATEEEIVQLKEKFGEPSRLNLERAFKNLKEVSSVNFTADSPEKNIPEFVFNAMTVAKNIADRMVEDSRDKLFFQSLSKVSKVHIQPSERENVQIDNGVLTISLTTDIFYSSKRGQKVIDKIESVL